MYNKFGRVEGKVGGGLALVLYLATSRHGATLQLHAARSRDGEPPPPPL